MQNLNILIVDDDKESVIPLERVLRQEGCHVIFVHDPLEAVKHLAQDKMINLVFLDWNMPQIEGGDAIALAEKSIGSNMKLAKDWSERHLPIVTYTGEDARKIRYPQTSHFAFIDYWPKSMGFEELLVQVREVLNYLKNKAH